MKKILILAFSDLRHDARISRQINFLKSGYEVTVACFETNGSGGFEVVKLARPRLTLIRKVMAAFFLLARFYETAHRLIYNPDSLKKGLHGRAFDLVIANDVESLPFAFQYGNGRVLFDAHEFAPLHFEDRLVWRIFFKGLNSYLCTKFIPRTAAMTTVGEGLASAYEKSYRVRPTVITNAAYYHDLRPVEPEQGSIKIIHHGGANPSRRLEQMINMMNLLESRFSLDLMLITPLTANAKTRAYLDQLKDLANANPKVRILPPVKSDEIIPLINHYDIGLFLLPPVNFNYKNTLPNKLFDFIQARLAIAIGPTPEMEALVKKYDLGVVSMDFTPESLARELNLLTPDRLYAYKQRSDAAAKILNAGTNEKLLKGLVAGLIP